MDIITTIKYMFLGLLQGVTEPIPVSSSGHLVIARELFGIEAKGLSFEIFLNTASLLAILFVYRNDIISIVQNLWRFLFNGARDNEAVTDFKYTICLIIATIPVGVAGLWFIKNKRGNKRDGDLTVKDSIIVGLAQCVALTPGISRSGAAIVGSIAVGLSQKNALRFAFLLYIPISVGTALISVGDIVNDPQMSTLWLAYLLAFIVTVIATYFAVKWLQNIMENGNLIIFVYYCFALGVFSILYQFIWA